MPSSVSRSVIDVRWRRAAALLLASAWAVSCTTTALSVMPRKSPPPAPPRKVARDTVRASSQAPGSPTSATAPAPPAAPVSGSAVPLTPLEWHPVVTGGEELELDEWNQEVLVSGHDGIVRFSGVSPVLTCLEDREQLHPGAADYLTSDFVPMSACPGAPALWRRAGEGWHHVRDLRVHDLLTTRWSQGRTLAATVPWRAGPPWGYELSVLEGGAAPRPTPAGPFEAADEQGLCYTRLQAPLRLIAFPTGEVFLLGAGECPEPLVGEVVVERWAAGEARGRFERLPLTTLGAIAAPAPDNLWLSGSLAQLTSTWLVHFDGRGWMLLPSPLEEPLVALVWEPAEEDQSEALWLLTERGLWRWRDPRMPGAEPAPEPFAPPQGCDTPLGLAQAGHELWLSCGAAVYTTASGIPPVAWPFEYGASCGRQLRRPIPPQRSQRSKTATIERGGCGPRGLAPMRARPNNGPREWSGQPFPDF